MGTDKFLINLKDRVYAFLTNPKKIKIFSIIGVSTLIFTLIVGYIIAQFDPDGYNIFNNYISDMGSFNHTPFPYLLDFGLMITACLMIPASFYMEKIFGPLPENLEDLKECSRMRLRLSSWGFLSMLIALFGMFNVGLFSEDRTTALHLHWIFTIVVFIGFAMTGFFYGLLITFYNTPIPKPLGVYMIFGPSIIAEILFSYGFIPLHEWIMLFSLIAWVIPVALLIYKHIEQEIASK